MTQPEEPHCADCGIPLSEDECHVCSDCCAFYTIFRDPNFYGEEGDE